MTAPQSHHIDLGEGATLHLKIAGSGRDIILIHGALTTHTDWMGALFQALTERGRVIAVDRPGHGDSRRPRYRATPLEQARQIRAGLQRLGVQRPVLIGHSFGGMVASAWASAYPDEIAGLMLVSPIAFPEFRPLEHPVLGPRALPLFGPWLAEAARILDPVVVAAGQAIMFAPQSPDPAWLARYPYRDILQPAAMVAEGEDAASMSPGGITGRVNYLAITAPVRILVGERDHIVFPLRHAKRLTLLLPRAELSVRFDAGHMVHHTASEDFLALVDDLLAAGGNDVAQVA